MLISILQDLFHRELIKLETEILAYPDETDLWKIKPGISNSGGNLALHIAGNLQHFTGAILGKSGYVRNREAEFSRKNVPREEVIQEIKKAASAVEKTLSGMTDADLDATYPVHIFDRELTVGFFLVHLLSHLGYHLGQINYHRRLLSSSSV